MAIGDSFTEGIGDPGTEIDYDEGFRGWADRVAEVLAAQSEDFAYANLGVRGKLLRGIREEQAEAALALRPDLIIVSAGGNDILRPGTDPEEVSRRLDELVGLLGRDGATIALFTGPDIGMRPVMRAIRGKVAIFNQHVHRIARHHDAIVIDLWALTELRDSRMWSPDRLHFSPLGHHTIALHVLAALGVEHVLEPAHPPPLPATPWRQARTEDLVWAREHLMPWVLRRLQGRSSGDGRPAKRPELHPLD